MNTRRTPSIKRSWTIFLQIVIVLVGLVTIALMLLEPRIEGRNAHATLAEIYFTDPFLAYVYTGSVAFFVVLYQAFKLLGYAAGGNIFTINAVRAVRTIKYCALVLAAFIVGAEAYFVFVQRRIEEDIAGGVMIGLVFLFATAVVGTAAAVFEKILQSAVDIKSENDLTV